MMTSDQAQTMINLMQAQAQYTSDTQAYVASGDFVQNVVLVVLVVVGLILGGIMLSRSGGN